jgi:hypothetical protein
MTRDAEWDDAAVEAWITERQCTAWAWLGVAPSVLDVC